MNQINELWANRKSNKLWVDQGREFYYELMQEWLDKNYIIMYSTHNEGKSVIKSKRYKKVTANDSKSDLSYLNRLVGQKNNNYHHSISKKPNIA